jgi:hypothetical protein
MPKTKISEYSTTNSANTDIEGINIDEGCPPSSINNAIREVMVHLKEFQTGASGDAFTFAGGTLMSGTNTISGAAVISGNINSSGTANTFSGGNVFSGTNTFSGTNIFSSDVTLNAQKDLRFADSDSSNWVAFQAPATVASNVTWTLPAADGTANQALVTDGSGTLSFATSSSLTGVTDSASPFETALGTGAGGSSTGVNNTFIGFEAGNDNTTGANNVAVGYQALDANTTGIRNTAVGSGALGANNTDRNTAIGFDALKVTTTGGSNTAVGAFALAQSTTAVANTAVGDGALYSNTTGSNNTSIGQNSMLNNTTGADNVAIGFGALDAMTLQSGVIAIGKNAFGAANRTSDTSSAGVCIGTNAGTSVTTGFGHLIIGENSGVTIATGVFGMYVGVNTTASAADVSDEMVIGTRGGTGKGGQTAFINPNGGGAYNGGNTTTWTTTSDQRIKKNIVDNNEGLDIVGQLRIRNFEYRLPEEIDGGLNPSDAVKKEGVQIGVIAQELAEVCPNCVTQESTGVFCVDTDEIFWHMVNAIKQLNAKVTALEAQLATPPAEPNA